MTFENVRTCYAYCDELGASVIDSTANVDGSIANIIKPVIDTALDGSANYCSNNICQIVAQDSSTPMRRDYSMYMFVFLDDRNFTDSNSTNLLQCLRDICSLMEGKTLIFVFPAIAPGEVDTWRFKLYFVLHPSNATSIFLPFLPRDLRQQTFAVAHSKCLIHQICTSLIIGVARNANLMSPATANVYRRYNLLTLMSHASKFVDRPELLTRQLKALPSRHFRRFVAELSSTSYQTMIQEGYNGYQNLSKSLETLSITQDDESVEEIAAELADAQEELARMQEERQAIRDEVKELRRQLANLEKTMTFEQLDAIRASESKEFELAFLRERTLADLAKVQRNLADLASAPSSSAPQ
jgi:regulator of replication initiation timing